MVIVKSKHTRRPPVPQGSEEVIAEPNKIAANTPFNFSGKNLTPYGGLLPVATMLEKLGFKKLVEETLHVPRIPRAMTIYQFLLGMVLALYVGFSRLSHLRFVAQDPMLTGVLQVSELPPQCTFWRFLASLHLQIAKRLLTVQRILRQRVWEAANVQLDTVTLDTDTTVHTLYGKQMGGRKSYNPKNRGKSVLQKYTDKEVA
jgi:Transposase DDE domain group 1